MRSRKDKPNGTDSVNLVLFEPESNWTPPTDFPDLDGCSILGIDTETKDPDLTTRGPGFFRGTAQCVGISVATPDRGWYFPIGHLGGGNLDKTRVVNYFKDLLSKPNIWVVGANLGYDLEVLDSLGITVAGKCVDIQVAEALIDENFDSYALEPISRRYLGVGKDEGVLRDAASCYAIDPKSELWKLHSRFVGSYAAADAHLSVRIFKMQLDSLKDQDLLPIFEMESRLIPIIYKMRKLGICVDLRMASNVSKELLCSESKIRATLRRDFGLLDEWSSTHIARLCNNLGIPYPKTGKGNPSFTSEFLSNSDESFFTQVRELRELNRLREVFVNQWIFENQINGIIHPVWHQLRKDEGGTRTGRMAASNPNPQQVPSRSEHAYLIRQIFIPEHGKRWAKIDYSQQEPRILVHFASLLKLSGAIEARDMYRTDPNMDIYQYLAQACGLSRRDAKTATLGRCYGMGINKFAAQNNIMYDEAKDIMDKFDRSVPFVKEIAEFCSNLASRRGWIKTLCGRKRHFTLWEPMAAPDLSARGKDVVPVREEEARKKWPNQALRRAHTHKSLNSLIQGSAADMTKAAMIAIYDQLGLVPHMQVHDELNYSVESEAQAKEIQHICETCVEMEVPIKADLTIGDHWK